MAVREIPLTRGKVALVDAEDYESLAGYRWHAAPKGGTWYAERAGRLSEGGPRTVCMHRVILSAPPGLMVDHIDGDGLNNRRSNLRLATHAQNGQNQRRSRANASGFKGVSWSSRVGRWQAAIRIAGRKVFLGYYGTPEEAHTAYSAAVEKFHGEFGRTA
jgi:hypothetical protein